MIQLTESQSHLLNRIEDHTRTTGAPLTLQNLLEKSGMYSLDTFKKCVKQLYSKGLIRSVRGNRKAVLAVPNLPYAGEVS